MGCRYTYKGMVFDTIEKLNDFLMSKLPYEPLLGDVAFSVNMSTKDAAKVFTMANRGAKLMEAKAMKRERRFAITPATDTQMTGDMDIDDIIMGRDPYIGVTTAIPMMVNPITGYRIVSQVVRSNYFGMLKQAINSLNLPVEERLGMISERDAKAIFGDNYERLPATIMDDDTFKSMVEDYFTDKWQFQADFGNAVHDVLQLFMTGLSDKVYTKTNNRIPIRRLMSDAERLSEFMRLAREGFDTMQYETSDRNKIVMPSRHVDGIPTTLLTDKQLRYLFDYATTLYDRIKGEPGMVTVNSNGVEYENFEMFGELPIYDDELLELSDYRNPGVTKQNKLLGSVDLIVFRKDGRGPIIIDYKTSPHPFTSWSSAKRNTYNYQLALYRAILNRAGINVSGSDCYLAPLTMGDVSMVDRPTGDNRHYTFTVGDFKDPRNLLEKVDTSEESLHQAVEAFLPSPHVLETTPDDLLQSIDEDYKAMFGEYDYEQTFIGDKYVDAVIKNRGAFDKDRGIWVLYKTKAKKDAIRISGMELADSDEMAFRKKVEMYLRDKPKQRADRSIEIYNYLKSKGSSAFMNTFGSGDRKANESEEYKFLNSVFEKYANGQWFVVENETAEKLAYYGIIMIENVGTHRIDIINITNEDVDIDRSVGKMRTLLTGKFYEDIREQQKGSPMMRANIGNMELMKTMIAINKIGGMFTDTSMIGDIQVVDTHGGSVHASNQTLRYNFNTLARLAKIKRYKGIQMMSAKDKIRTDLMDIQMLIDKDKENKERNFKYIWSNLGQNTEGLFYTDDPNNQDSFIYDIDKAKNDTQAINAYIRLQHRIESLYPNVIQSRQSEQDNTLSVIGADSEIMNLYTDISNAILELQGFSMRQQLEESGKWHQFSLTQSLTRGYTSLQLDNPGMLHSDLLNDVTKYTSNCYQNIRDDMQGPLTRIIAIENDLQALNGDNSATMLFRDREKMWEEFLVHDAEGNVSDLMMFKRVDDPSLSKEKQEILRRLLTEINRFRYFDSLTGFPTDAEVWARSDSDAFYNAPIAIRRGDRSDDRTPENKNKNMLGKLKRGLEYIMDLKSLREYVRDKVSTWGRDKQGEVQYGKELFELSKVGMTDDNPEARANYIRSVGMGAIDFNMANASLQYIFNNRMDEHMTKAIVLAKCAVTYLKTEGKRMNRSFANDIEYLVNFVKSKINNLDINDPRVLELKRIIDKTSQFAMRAVLSFSPVQFIYQSFQGDIVNYGLAFKRVTGQDGFNTKELASAEALVKADMFHNSNSKIALINRLYGINDLDMNDYVRKANDRNSLISMNGIFKLGMMFTSRPDYYNRMTLFTAQMMHDGVWDAYSVKDGILVYDFKKDKRFDKLVDPNATKDDEYYKQLSLYRAMAKQMMREGISNPDGTTFFVSDADIANGKIVDLPKAYTNQLSEAYKNVADDVYGYYSHEKKAMIHAHWIGGMFMQLKTFFSGKKNQYLMPGGVKMRGQYKQATELVDGKEEELFMYMDEMEGVQRIARKHINEDGSVEFIDDMGEDGTSKKVDEKKCIPFMQWKGRYQIGVIPQIAQLLSLGCEKDMSLRKAWDYYKYHPDQDVRDAFNANLRQLLSDLFVMILLGGLATAWLKDKVKVALSEGDISEIQADVANIFIKSISNSSLDSNVAGVFTSVFGSWTPFTMEYMGKFIPNTFKLLVGDKSMSQFATSSFSVVNQFKNSVEYLFPEEDEEE